MIARRDRFVQTGWQRVLDQVGTGHLIGKLTVNQVYAKYQHERLDLHHPRGGEAKFLQNSIYRRYTDYLQHLADEMLHGDPAEAMAQNMEALNSAMSAATPIELNNLRRSGHPRVYDRGRKVYDRAPWQPRLNRTQLRALRRGRGRR